MSLRASLKSFFSLPQALWEETRVTGAALVVLICVGFAIATFRPEWVEPMLRAFTDAAAEMGLYQASNWNLMAVILANNLLTLLTVIAAGLLPLLHLPALSLGLNALLIGGLGAFYQHCPTAWRSFPRSRSPAPRDSISAAPRPMPCWDAWTARRSHARWASACASIRTGSCRC